MIKIDGSKHEGGGAILRTALSLSLITGKAFEMQNIRKNRTKKGLKKQHVAVVKLAQLISDSKSAEVFEGSSKLEFYPGDIKKGSYEYDIGSAGSISLILHALSLPIFISEKQVKINIKGGTDVSFSPSIDYLKHVFLTKFNGYGDVSLKVTKRGYFPKGRGVVSFNLKGRELPIDLTLKKTNLTMIRIFCNASDDYMNLSMLEKLQEKLSFSLSNLTSKFNSSIKFFNEYSKSSSSDISVTCIANFENGHTLGVCDIVSNYENLDTFVNKISKDFSEKINDDNDLDEHMTNLILMHLDLFGSTNLNAKISSHAESIMYVCNKFIDSKIKIDKKNNEIISF